MQAIKWCSVFACEVIHFCQMQCILHCFTGDKKLLVSLSQSHKYQYYLLVVCLQAYLELYGELCLYCMILSMN